MHGGDYLNESVRAHQSPLLSVKGVFVQGFQIIIDLLNNPPSCPPLTFHSENERHSLPKLQLQQ